MKTYAPSWGNFPSDLVIKHNTKQGKSAYNLLNTTYLGELHSYLIFKKFGVITMNEACRILNDALATEIVCVMRYRDHQMVARKLNSPEVSVEFSTLARNKEQHLKKIAERISQLGGSPDFDPESVMARTIYPYESLMGHNLIDLIQDDLVAERVVIDIYQKLIHWFKDEDFVTQRMLEEFIKDEENNSRDLLALVSSQFQSH